MRTMAVVNAKGGSGKTTTAVNLAAALGEAGRTVLVIDLDPQASATTWFGHMTDGRGLFDAMVDHGDLSCLVADVTNVRNVSLVPGSGFLMGFDKATAGEVGAETLLRKAVEKLQQRWDYVIVDCPPTLGLLSLSALVACRHALVPVEATPMALAGLATLLNTVERVRDRLNPALSVAGVVACRVDTRRKLARDAVQLMRDRLADRMMKTVVRENVRLAEAYSFKQPVTLYDPRSTGAEDYRDLGREISRRIKKESS